MQVEEFYDVCGTSTPVQRGAFPWSRHRRWFNADPYSHETVFDRWDDAIRFVWPDAEVWWDHRGVQVDWGGAYYLKIVRVRHPQAQEQVDRIELNMRLQGMDPRENELRVQVPDHGWLVAYDQDEKRQVRDRGGRFKTEKVRVCWAELGVLGRRGWEHQAELRAVRKTLTGGVWRQGGVQMIRWVPAREWWEMVGAGG